jgi:hypothetical protein
MVKRRTQLETFQAADFSIQTDGIPNPMTFVKNLVKRRFSAATTYIGEQLPWEGAVVVIEELAQELEGLANAIRSPESSPTDEKSEEGYLDENCEPFSEK